MVFENADFLSMRGSGAKKQRFQKLVSMKGKNMFGLGAGKKYREKVIELANNINVMELIPSMAPLHTEIENYRNNNFSEHEAVLLLSYSSALSIAMANNIEKAQKLYDRARDQQDRWISLGYVNQQDAASFNKHISENSKLKVRL